MAVMDVWPTDGEDGSIATEAKWRKMGRLFAPDSVVANAGGELALSLAGTALTVQSGAVWIDGHYAELAGSQNLTVTANGLVVIRFDPAANIAELVYRDGATVPEQNPNGIWEMVIGSVSGSVLTDSRNILPVSGNGVIRRTVALTFASQTVTSTRVNLGGAIVIPSANYARLLNITASVLPNSAVILDMYLAANGASLKRVRLMAGSEHSMGLTYQHPIAAGVAAVTINAQFAAPGGSGTVSLLGGGDINWMHLTEYPV